jgi:ABC-type uncharacterized transport system auxiliary subunit
MNRLRHSFTLFAFAIVLAGCASMGNEPAQTFGQRFAYAVGVHTAILQATTSSLTAGTITSGVAETVLAQADTAKVALDAAKAAYDAGDPTTANGKLVLALTALQALQDYLRAHAGSKP